jgi:hypothetical protein
MNRMPGPVLWRRGVVLTLGSSESERAELLRMMRVSNGAEMVGEWASYDDSLRGLREGTRHWKRLFNGDGMLGH